MKANTLVMLVAFAPLISTGKRDDFTSVKASIQSYAATRFQVFKLETCPAEVPASSCV
ncbi:uncharacterized protein PHALS_11386 [Plasmopara halstedii]|uniref:RxLR-like protein n=1 Tax=Plasmopara halstedii TaxID=4781 RepID=A0A0P1A5V8_PLAHL|nr:uncharacterized protein PHALS_11386 [Plasmopara halstedii]CEG35508.1 hypothetical protein PHALS_11386 [Plasmopara halstedii]|eukprot:XP_024571877.1 hypothetical protein PHALS_11386 [Plasmopara halstedii]